jgi:hypothetical protein
MDMTNEEHDDLLMHQDLYKEWKQSLPKAVDYDWASIFPDQKKLIVSGLKRDIEHLEERLKEISKHKKSWNDKPWSVVWLADIAKGELSSEESHIHKLIKQKGWLIQGLKRGELVDKGRITDADIAEAKRVPLSQFYIGQISKKGRYALALCPFHNEDSPSFTIYLEQNTYWCYACSEGSDVIGFVMKQKNLKFIEAVRYILHK